LRLDEFWLAALPPSREGTSWLNILKTLVGYRLISPGSEWRLHRHWFEHSAMGDLLGEDLALVQPNNLYRCLDKLTAHKQAMFTFLGERWKELFQADFEVLLYDLKSDEFSSVFFEAFVIRRWSATHRSVRLSSSSSCAWE
jgi:hypothetical protein